MAPTPRTLQFRGKVMDLLGEPPEIIRIKILTVEDVRHAYLCLEMGDREAD